MTTRNKGVIVLEVNPKFELGRVVVTTSIDMLMTTDSSFCSFVQVSLGKYVQCDWGDTCAEDRKNNDEALNDGERILAVYIDNLTNKTIWIITEWDRSVTTILFPEEY